jgi:hypothetical protein
MFNQLLQNLGEPLQPGKWHGDKLNGNVAPAPICNPGPRDEKAMDSFAFVLGWKLWA